MSAIRIVTIVTLFSAATLVHGPAGASTLAPSSIATTTLPASVRLSPTTKTVTVGSKVTLTVTVNTGSRPVNTVQAFLTFPDASFDCSTVTLGTTFTVKAASLCNGNQAAIAAAIPAGASNFTGTTVVGKFTFTARHTRQGTRGLRPQQNDGRRCGNEHRYPWDLERFHRNHPAVADQVTIQGEVS